MRNYSFLSNSNLKIKLNKLTNFVKKLTYAITPDNYDQIKVCYALLVCSDADRGYVFNNKAYAQITDSLGDWLQKKGVAANSVSQSFTYISPKKTHGCQHIRNRFLLRNLIFSRCIKKIMGYAAAELWTIEDRVNNWKKILKKSNAKIVLAIQPEAALCRAGHELAVQIIDVQHGVISDSKDNPYYWSENIANKSLTDIPHCFFCWDENSAAVLESLAINKKFDIVVIGNPWYSRFIAPNKEDLLVQEELSNYNEINTQPAILVTLQNNLSEYAPDYVENGIMSKCLERVIIKNCNNYFWYIRLHPSQMNSSDDGQTIKYLVRKFSGLSNIDWDIASKAALPLLLKKVDLHITHFSAATIEASWMGIKTGLLDPHIKKGQKHADLFVYERNQGCAELIQLDENAIENFIVKELFKKNNHVERKNFNEYALSSFLPYAELNK